MSSSSTSNNNQLSQQQTSRVLMTLLFGGVVVSLNNSALNPAIPVFMQVFDVNIVMASWVLNAYMLGMSVGLMLSGYLSRRFAFKPVYIAAFVGFGLSSFVGLQATSMAEVIVARAIQGVCGGLIIPFSIGLIYQLYPQNKHGRMMALWGIVIMLSLSIGPLFGAYLVEKLGWQLVFSTNAGLSIILLLTALILLPITEPEQTQKSFDLFGFISLFIWLVALTTWLSKLSIQDFTGQALLINSAIATVFIFTAVRWWQYQSGHNAPIINVQLFRNSVYLNSIIISVSQTLGLMMCLVLMPIIVQQIMGQSAIWTGIALLVATLVTSITTHFAGKKVDRSGARNIGIAGIVISAISTLLLAWCLYAPELWTLIAIISLRGIGVGLSYLPTTSVGFSSLPKEAVTEGAAINNISRRIASTLFIAFMTVYIESRESQMLTTLSAQATAQAMQEVFVFVAAMLVLTLPSAYKLPKSVT